MMLYEANLDALKRCVRNNKNAHNFDLATYLNKDQCGTFGCLVGNDLVGCGIGIEEAYLLHGGPERWGARQYQVDGELNDEPTLWNFLFGFWRRPENRRSREDCINRLRKTIQYIERKRAIWYEADGRISERARRTEGNWNVCASVLSSISVSA